MNEEIILGIDPGTNVMGFSIIKVCHTKTEVLKMGVLNIIKLNNQAIKLKKIFETVTELIETYQPKILAVEEPFYGKNPQSMLKLGRAQGVIIGASIRYGLDVFEYTPRRIKQSITGKGCASKEQVAAMLKHLVDFEYHDKYLDATDALAVAVCHQLQNKALPMEKQSNSWTAFIHNHESRIIK